MSEENTASQERVIHEVEEIGEIRARAGTSTAELAGAASYWNKEAKRLAGELSEVIKLRKEDFDLQHGKAWKSGFLTAAVAIATIEGLILAYSRLL
jgi:hypothetical protein